MNQGKAYAVIGPSGNYLATPEEMRSWRAVEELTGHSRPALEALGYRCEPVTITPVGH